jgi:hypothetical protein
MGTEIITTSFDESGSLTAHTAAITRVVAGSPEARAHRLVGALERLGFHVLEEQPLLAKRRTRGWGAYGCTTMVRELPTTLLVKLKAAEGNSTQVTFNYTIKGSMLLRGDWRVIAREVDAAVALAVAGGQAGTCALCGTEAADDSRFCRRCGAPLASYEPVELDTLRLSAASEAGTQAVGFGLLFVVLGLLLMLLASFAPEWGLKNPAKLAAALTLFAWTLGGTGLLGVLNGYFKMRRALDAAPERELGAAAARRDGLSASRTGRLPAAPEYLSVTEHTTELLDPVPARRSTGEIE